MQFPFEWNPYADQPHNIAPRKERLKHHLRHADTYFSLAASNLRRAVPVLVLYRKYRKKMYKEQVHIDDPFSLSVSPIREREDDLLSLLGDLDVRKTLVRIPSWDPSERDRRQKFSLRLFSQEKEVTLALLQNREDVIHPSRWSDFVEDVFSRFHLHSSFFEVGHAWNRTKWGVWDYKEYLRLAGAAVNLAGKYRVNMVGPAVIDFEFHLYPPVLHEISFDKVTSLLYVDRTGAPERKQLGWDTPRKIALLKAVVDRSQRRRQDLWITEVNWPLRGMGKYSPASGRPNVSEEEQADYLVRYYILCVCSGFVERIYWWQLAAPGYGLIDNRGREWRKRPSFYAMKTMVGHLRGSTFLRRMDHSQAELFFFSKGGKDFVVCWTRNGVLIHRFARKIAQVISRDGKQIPCSDSRVEMDGSPKYIFFDE